MVFQEYATKVKYLAFKLAQEGRSLTNLIKELFSKTPAIYLEEIQISFKQSTSLSSKKNTLHNHLNIYQQDALYSQVRKLTNWFLKNIFSNQLNNEISAADKCGVHLDSVARTQGWAPVGEMTQTIPCEGNRLCGFNLSISLKNIGLFFFHIIFWGLGTHPP
ncbi:hypothetical protein VP01_967g7 [Puccinia sorghi]|uniref:Uncharacterized protein n=1 Tax=Puccinia sorghi TaxID=27349 RepID=A0A0L6U612_9BASI|nr:hypothetical protein VP01_967g7 [Puccinia sorghi]